jgi:PAS domain S-box-containing protein
VNWRFTSYAVPLFVGAAILFGISLISWRRRSTRGAVWMCLLGLAPGIYVLGYALELGSTTLSEAMRWLRVEYIGVVTVPVILLCLILTYTDHQRLLTPVNLMALCAVPAMTLIYAWTNRWHELIWKHPAFEAVGDRYAVIFTPGLWYWVHVAYLWTLVMGSIILLVRAYPKATGLYRKQVCVFLVAVAVPLVAFAVYLSGLGPTGLDLTPFALIVTAVAMAWGIFNYQMLDIVPVAREAVVASMTDAVVVLDTQNRVVDLNPAGERLFGPDPQRCVGRLATECFPKECEVTVEGEATLPSQAEIALQVQGSKRFFDMRLSPLYSRSGRREGRLIVLRDITRSKQAENERERLIAELDAFAHTVAHDLKTPVTVLMSYTLFLLDGYTDMPEAEIRENLETIVQTGQEVNGIIDALLLLASVDKMEKVPVGPLSMGEIVAEAQKRLATLIVQAKARIGGPETWPVALGYAPWIEEVWVNYLSNAVKYGGEPPVVTLGAAIQPDGMIRCWVRDNGHGLTAEEQQRLFTEFTRLHGSQVEGHGLGLSIARHIVEKLGGKVGVESTIGDGTVFSFTLPKAPGTE